MTGWKRDGRYRSCHPPPPSHDAPVPPVPARLRGAAPRHARPAPGVRRLRVLARFHRRLPRQPSGLPAHGPRPGLRALLQAHHRLPRARPGDGKRPRVERRPALGEAAKADAADVREPQHQPLRRDDQLAHVDDDGRLEGSDGRRGLPCRPRDAPARFPDRRRDPVRERHRPPFRRSREDPGGRQPAAAGAPRAHDAPFVGPDPLQPQVETREEASGRHRVRDD